MRFSELVDLGELQALCHSFTETTGIVTAIVDLEGNVLTATGWHEGLHPAFTGHTRLRPNAAGKAILSWPAICARASATTSTVAGMALWT